MSAYIYEELTKEELRVLRNKKTIILLSFGSIEQHSTHLPVGTDFLCSFRRVKSIADKTESIVFAPLQLGFSYNHRGMFGTVSLLPETMLKIVTEILDQLCDQGWKRMILFSGHTGNWNILELAKTKTKEKFKNAEILLARGPFLPQEQKMERYLRHLDLHAGKIETAIWDYYFPRTLDYSTIPQGNTALPSIIKKLSAKKKYDYIDMMLLQAILPQHTELISNTGAWGIDTPKDYKMVPIKKAMNEYESFYVKLIKRWNSLIRK